ncbi:hypothetical protein GOP47_0028215 [Adiantum capillus-veneris]|nr:hypothetical protein GOP47_0028215 [Adiantum capillus-veneris]
MKLSNTLLGILNTITLLISLPIIGAGIWLTTKDSNECGRLLQWPAIALGVFILLVSLAGLVGAFCKRRGLLIFYTLVVFLLILAIIAFTIFAVIVTNKGAGHAVSDKGFKEYRLGDYSTWLQRHVVNKPAYWRKIKSCLIHSKVCKDLQDDSRVISLSSFYQENLSPIQSGCCKPPTACNFTFVDATTWNNATNVTADSDCREWSNAPDELCFDCQSCKAGVLQNIKSNWKKLVIFDAAIVVFLILIFTMGCCAIANSRRDRHRVPPPGFYVKA